MAEVKVLVEGYGKEVEGGWIASSSATLVRANGKNIVVDPGCNRSKLVAALRKEGLKTGDIGFVLLTHVHADHTLLAGAFENAKIMTPAEIYDNDYCADHNNVIPGTDLKIIQTPGHSGVHCALVVPTAKGTCVIAGDLFWWVDGQEQRTDNESLIDLKDPFEKDRKALVESRKQILKIADWIIPGHGKPFKVMK